VRDESVAVQCQLIFEPAGLGICANEDEQGARFPAQGRSRARTGVVRPPGGTVRFGDAAAAWCGEHCRVVRDRRGRSAVNSGGPRTKTHSVGQRGMLAARLAGRLDGPW
jgi:hypothetical protein